MSGKIRGAQVKDDSITGDDVDESTLIITQLRDTDGDTKIQIEESADEDEIRFDTAGVQRMVITSNGNVGIGTDNPDAAIHVEALSAGPNIGMSRNHASVTNNDQFGNIIFHHTFNGTNHRPGGSIRGQAAGVWTDSVKYPTDILLQTCGDSTTQNTVLIVSGSGDILIANKMQHIGDEDTYIQFTDDMIELAAGGRTFIKLEEASQDKLIVNHGGLNIDLKVSGQNQANLIRTDAAEDRVGIGTGSPISELDVSGKIAITTEQGSTPSAPVDGKGWLYTKADGRIYWQSFDIGETDLTAGSSSLWSGNGTSVSLADTSDNLILGPLASSTAKLHVASDTTTKPGSFDTPTLVLEADGAVRIQYFTDGSEVSELNFGDPTSAISGQVKYHHGSDYMRFTTAASERLRIDSAGNVGIGTNAPQSKLDVEGGVAIGATYSGTTTAPANGLIVEGNVGLGDESPTAHVEIKDTLNALAGAGNRSNYSLFLHGNSATVNEGTGLGFARATDSNDVGAGIIFKRTGSESKGELQFKIKTNTTDGGTPNTRVLITDSGGVGIGESITELIGTDASNPLRGQLNIHGKYSLVDPDGPPEINLSVEKTDGAGIGSATLLSSINFWGNETSSTASDADRGASIEVNAAEDWTATSSPARIIFKTTKTSSTTPNEVMVIGHDGKVGISDGGLADGAPQHMLHVEENITGEWICRMRNLSTSGNDKVLTLDISHVTDGGDTWVAFKDKNLSGDYVSEGKITGHADGGAVFHGTATGFTGMHPALIEIGTYERGSIVATSGQLWKKIGVKDAIPYIQISSKANLKNAYGVISVVYTDPTIRFENDAIPDGYAVTEINSIGDGCILVTNIDGEIANGDYITTSPIAGYGQKQNDDLLHSYTVAKCIETIDWESITETVEYNGATYKKYLAGCTYHCG